MLQTDSLTEKQRRRIRRYVDTWTDLDFSDNKEAVKAVHGLYDALGIADVKIRKFSDPLSCTRSANAVDNRSYRNRFRRLVQLRYNRPAGLSYKRRVELAREFRTLARQDIRRQLETPFAEEIRRYPRLGFFPLPYRTARHYRSVMLAGCANVAGLLNSHFRVERMEAWERVAKSCFWVWLYPNDAIICSAPTQIKRDMNGRFHNEHGPAIKWGNKFSLYFWHGVHVSSVVIERPTLISLTSIYQEQNLEVRRVLIERYGMENFFKDSHAKLFNIGELGELYEIRIPGQDRDFWAMAPQWIPRARARVWNVGTRMRIVKVKNSTPEKDGTYKYYYLQVPNNIETADDAVAWTFGYRSARRYKRALQQET